MGQGEKLLDPNLGGYVTGRGFFYFALMLVFMAVAVIQFRNRPRRR